jgi:hypothetical protein
MINFFSKFGLVLRQNAIFFAEFFRRKYLKNHNIGPRKIMFGRIGARTLTEHGLYELSEDGDDLAPEPLVPLLQVEHLVHEEQHDPEGRFDEAVSAGSYGQNLNKVQLTARFFPTNFIRH